jgi:hypothetical protein
MFVTNIKLSPPLPSPHTPLTSHYSHLTIPHLLDGRERLGVRLHLRQAFERVQAKQGTNHAFQQPLQEEEVDSMVHHRARNCVV